MRISLYLMTQKGYNVLCSLIENKMHEIISEVIIGTDKNIENDYATEIAKLCRKVNINFFTRNDNVDIESDYAIAISWRWLIKNIKSKLIVLHDSILPKYRGFSPLVNMLINQEPTIGVTALFASEDYDKGDIICQSSSNIVYPIKIQQAINIISNNYCEVVNSIFKKIHNGEILYGKKQNEKEATYSLWRNEDDYYIDWNMSAEKILTFVNSISSPYRGAATTINGDTKIRIIDVQLVKDLKIEIRDVGKVISIDDNKPIVVCGTGLLKILTAYNDGTGESVLPLKKFRVKFT